MSNPEHRCRGITTTELDVRAAFPAQELTTPESAGLDYWEGAVEVRGTARGTAVRGRGYLEMTGYAGAALGEILR